MKRDKFYDALRGRVNLTTQNVFGTEKILDYAMDRGVPLQYLKYNLATAFWETAGTMTPVREAYWMSEEWRRRHLRYYPWYGRGLIQTTWESNYKRMWKALGMTGPMNPERFLDWDVALPALFVGMEQGLYTGKNQDDYIDLVDESDFEDFQEMRNARRVVNRMDKAAEIANLGLKFEKALKAGGYPF